ncbi:hypothetical protein [Bradyrhizobium sp. BRP22]|uniref:hypothetical protein n=1 Tax=Bradyrhizobium sp. BRP22 TaxID=2793821 RepID=UPI00201C0BE9|nr:hypothetical protein [Bradyrhizobium sp. BRP22]
MKARRRDVFCRQVGGQDIVSRPSHLVDQRLEIARRLAGGPVGKLSEVDLRSRGIRNAACSARSGDVQKFTWLTWL